MTTETNNTRDTKTGRFLAGNPGGPGGNRVCGRTGILRILDKVLEEEGSKEALQDALRDELNKRPIKFFKEIIMPLLPKESKVEMQAQGKIVWRSIADSFRTNEKGEVEYVPDADGD